MFSLVLVEFEKGWAFANGCALPGNGNGTRLSLKALRLSAGKQAGARSGPFRYPIRAASQEGVACVCAATLKLCLPPRCVFPHTRADVIQKYCSVSTVSHMFSRSFP